MAHVNVKPEEVLSKILNEVFENIVSLASGDSKNCKDRINIT